jgi:hypothetical protein
MQEIDVLDSDENHDMQENGARNGCVWTVCTERKWIDDVDVCGIMLHRGD